MIKRAWRDVKRAFGVGSEAKESKVKEEKLVFMSEASSQFSLTQHLQEEEDEERNGGW